MTIRISKASLNLYDRELCQNPTTLKLPLQCAGGSDARLAPGFATEAPEEAIAAAPAQQSGLNLLFIQPAKSGSLVLQSNNNQTGELVLKDVSKFTIWFTDTPARTAGQVAASHLETLAPQPWNCLRDGITLAEYIGRDDGLKTLLPLVGLSVVFMKT